MRASMYLVAGLSVGFGLGVAVGGWVREGTPPAPDVATPKSDASPETPADVTVPPIAPAVLAGTTQETTPDGATDDTPPPDVERLREDVASAREDGSWPRLLSSLAALGAANTPEADRELVDVLGEAGVVFLEPIHAEYRVWLSGTEVEGVAAATRRRIAADVATYGITEMRAARPWVLLLAEHGDREDLLWLKGDPFDIDFSRKVDAAFLASGRPEAVDLARRQVLGRYGSPPDPELRFPLRDAFQALARAHPATALAELEEEMDRAGRGECRLPPHFVVPLYARTLPPERLGHGVGQMLALFDRLPDETVQPVLQAMAILEARGLDTAGLSPVLAWPAAHVLYVAARGGPGKTERYVWQRALFLLLGSDRLASEETIEALRAALPFVEDEHGRERERVQRRIHAIRASLQRRAEER